MFSPANRLHYLLKDLESVEFYVKILERNLEKEANLYEESLKTDNEKLAYRFDYRVDLSYDLNHLFPFLHRGSTLATIFSHLEFRFLQLCDDIIEYDKLDVDFEVNKSKSGIDQAKNFINKKTRYNFPSDNQSWQEIKRVQKIRHLIIHNQGIIPKDYTDLKNFISNNEYLSFNIVGERRWIIIESQFLNNFLETVEDFVKTFLNHIRKIQNA